jgi:hypothetical protein
MAAQRVYQGVTIAVTLATTLTRLNPADDVRTIWLNAPADTYLVYDDALDDGAALPAGEYTRIPANTSWPIEVTGVRPLVAAATGSTAATLLGSP